MYSRTKQEENVVADFFPFLILHPFRARVRLYLPSSSNQFFVRESDWVGLLVSTIVGLVSALFV